MTTWFSGLQTLRASASNVRVIFIATRYVSAVLVAGEALIFARILGPESYGSFALVAQIAGLLMFLAAGSNAGYVYAYYKGVYKGAEATLDDQYLSGVLCQFIVGALVVGVFLALYRTYFLLGVVLVLIQMPYMITEPMLRVRNRFTVVAMAKGFSSLVTLALAGAWFAAQGHAPLELRNAVAIMLAGNLIGYGSYYAVVLFKRYLVIDVRSLIRSFLDRRSWATYWEKVLRPGLPMSASNVILIFLANIDRLFIDHYRPASALSVYSLAWQLSQGAILMLGSLNIISGVRVGERLTGDPNLLVAELGRQFRLTAIAGALGFVALVGGAMVLSVTVYRDYTDLVLITALVSAGYIAMNVAGSVTGLMLYERRTVAVNLGYAGVLVACVAGNALAIRYGLWYGVPVALTSFWLFCLNVGFTLYTRELAQRIRRQNLWTQPA